MQQDELRKTKIAMEAAIYGINKKRNRNQIDGIEYEDSEDEMEKKKEKEFKSVWNCLIVPMRKKWIILLSN